MNTPAMTNDAPAIRRRDVPAHGPWPAELPEVLQRVYAARGLREASQIELGLSRLLPPDTLSGIGDAVSLLAGQIASQREILVVGDFDCDGATGTAVAVRGLRLLGAAHVAFRVPHRQRHGYGLSSALVDELGESPGRLILTVDNGIACHAGVAAAKARGWRVLISDHHLPGATLPPADAIVNPNLPGDAFPSKALAGVGVVFYLLLALRQRLREQGRLPVPEVDLGSLLDLVAVGTVADLVPLDPNNRLLVAAGLRRLRRGQGQPGLLALADVSGRSLAALTASDIGFSVAPRLNAAGRLEDMAVGIECLLSDDHAQARVLALQLDAINAERRGLQQQMVDEAQARLLELDTVPADALTPCLYDPDWHPGVIGLVASKLKERLHRPVLAFAPIEPGSTDLRGSARSIPGFHLRDALAAVDARYPGLIQRFGGHAMAAGLSLAEPDLPAFRAAFSEVAAGLLTPELLRSELWSDGPLGPADFTRERADQLGMAGPWGQGFPEPTFDNVFEVTQWRVVGERHLKLSLRPDTGGAPVSAIHFGGWNGNIPPARLHALYQLAPDDYRDAGGVQLLLRHWLPA